MRNVNEYRCWHALLQLSDRKKWTAQVEETFGPYQHLSNFDDWWAALRGRFDEMEPFLLEVVTTPEEFEHWYVGDGDDVAVVINLLATKTELLAALTKLLDERHKGKRGRPKRDDWADIPMIGTPNVAGITRAIDVYKESKRPPKRAQWRIGADLHLHSIHLKKDEVPTYDEQRALSAAVNRYIKRVEKLIKGVEQGRFPEPV